MAITIRAMQQSSANPVSGVASYWMGLDPVTAAVITLAVDSTQTNDDVLDLRGVRTLAVKPSASVTTLTCYGCDTNNGTFVLIDSLGTNGVVTVVASKWNVFDPTKIGPIHFIQMKSDQAGATAVVMAKN